MSEQLEDKIGVLAGRLHATTAAFVDMVAAFDEAQGWVGEGLRGCAHWLTIATGIDLGTARAMLRVGHALRELPRIHEAFVSGRLSFDKVRVICWVARPEDEEVWLELALQASGSQLATICRQFRRAVAIDDPQRSATQRARRRVVSWWLDQDGMLALYATLPPEEGRLVLAAIESAVRRPLAVDVVGDPCAEEADHPHGARRADALVRICERWLHEASSSSEPPAATNPQAPTAATETPAPTAATNGDRPTGAAGSAELVVHVDLDTLVGTEVGGRCHIDGGPALSVAAARRLGCDARVVTVLERDGVPLDVGRSQRMVSGRLRRLVQLRDQGCRYPGCTVPVWDTECHHVTHWLDEGRTDLANLVCLCRFHHHRYHEGTFRIVATSPSRTGEFRFETAEGREIAIRGTATDGAIWPPGGPHITPNTPAALGRGERYDLDHTILVLANRPPGRSP